MPSRKKLKKANDVTTKSGRVVKKPDREITQNCVLRSVSQANSVKREKNREDTARRVREFRARQKEKESKKTPKDAKNCSK